MIIAAVVLYKISLPNFNQPHSLQYHDSHYLRIRDPHKKSLRASAASARLEPS